MTSALFAPRTSSTSSTSTRAAAAALALVTALAAAAPAASEEPQANAAGGTAQAVPAVVTGAGFKFTEVRPGVWHVQGLGEVAAGSNGALVVGERDCLLVDSHMTPAAARALLIDLPKVTDKSIRYVVNTHFHFDHVQGNQVFGPDVELIAHEWTAERIQAGASRRGRAYEFFIGGGPSRIEAMKDRLQADAELPDEERERIGQGIARTQALLDQDAETVLTAPTLTLDSSVTLTRGGREIELHFFGRGHTAGDIVVYLPEERILISGDLVVQHLPYLGDAYLEEWADTLGVVGELPIEAILPGHGNVIEGAERIGHLESYLRDLWSQVVASHEAGVSAEEAAQTIDMTAHAVHYLEIEGPGAPLHGVERAYALLDGSEP